MAQMKDVHFVNKYKQKRFFPVITSIDSSYANQRTHQNVTYLPNASINFNNKVTSVNFSTDEEVLLISYATQICLYNYDLEKIKSKGCFKSPINSCKFRFDNRLICTGSEDGHAAIVNAKSFSVLRRFHGHLGSIESVSFVGNPGVVLATAGQDACLRLWDISTADYEEMVSHHDLINMPLFIFEGMRDKINSISTQRLNEHLILSGSEDCSISLIDTRDPTISSFFTYKFDNPVYTVELLKHQKLALIAEGNMVHLLDFNTKKIIFSQKWYKPITSFTVFDDQNMFMHTSLDRCVRIYDMENFNLFASYTSTDPLICSSISNDKKYIALGSLNNKLESLKIEHNSEDTIKIDEKIYIPKNPKQLQSYDKCFLKFNNKNAFDSSEKRSLWIIIPVLRELIRRDSLDMAFRDRSDEYIEKVLNYFIENLYKNHATPILIDSIKCIIEANISVPVYDPYNGLPQAIIAIGALASALIVSKLISIIFGFCNDRRIIRDDVSDMSDNTKKVLRTHIELKSLKHKIIKKDLIHEINKERKRRFALYLRKQEEQRIIEETTNPKIVAEAEAKVEEPANSETKSI
ncbi:U3 small nucleolar RNA-associated protein 15 [Intoshia linei]|uniref:U3 small nucleolar RNA-associated protein 15 homolog n=1 Tax=Intoshia linei TaxID=1819745 RepID=A0A177BCA9_9BILA|nr:U3 small nucleolar RNA-associated protein 15 [Intoshia linei]